MIAHRAPVGGEGNGGAMYPALHVGRDAPVGAALTLALLARGREPLSDLVAAAPRYAIVKMKVGAERDRLPVVYQRLRRRFADAAVDTQDGLRLAWPGRWLHVRPSNTEPIVRFIAEASDRVSAAALAEEGVRICAES
jgi:phosphomannomutase